jgi:hypothetical protein
MNVLSKVDELAGLDLHAVVVIHDVVSGFEAAVVEVLMDHSKSGHCNKNGKMDLCLIDPRVVVMRERGTSGAGPRVGAGHVVEECV